MDQFSQELGRLTGQLESLVPTLERLETRLNDIEKKAAAADATAQYLSRDFAEFKQKVSNRLGDIYKKLEAQIVENVGQKGDIQSLRAANGSLKRELSELKKNVGEKEKTIGKRVWDVVKILLTASVPAIIAWQAGRH